MNEKVQSLGDKIKKIGDNIKKFIIRLIKSPLFRKIVLIALILIVILLLFVIASYLIMKIDTVGGDDGGPSTMSKTVTNTISDFAGIGKRKGVVPNKGNNTTGNNTTGNNTTGNNTTGNNTTGNNTTGNNTTKPTGTGKGEVISESDYETTGYSGVYRSGMTGREFIEFKQNADTYLNQYPIESVGCNWHSECGTVTTIIIGSGYSEQATLEDAWNNLKDNGGNTDLNGWIKKYAPNAQVENTSIDKENIISLLSQGAVLAVHSPTLTANGHWIALLDINSDHTQVYVSNPWGGPAGDPAGWSDIDRVQGLLDSAVAVSNDGDLLTHNGTGNKGGATYTTTNVVNHITENGRGGYKIDLDLDEMVDKITESLKEQEETRLLEYFTDSNRKKYLKSFLKSAIVTQYPDLRTKNEIGTEVPEGELQGVVKVKRRYENEVEEEENTTNNIDIEADTSETELIFEKNEDNKNKEIIKDNDSGNKTPGEYLQYIPLDNFNEMKKNGDKNIFKYYTLDSNSYIVVAGYEKRTVEPQTVDYGGDPRKDSVEDESKKPIDEIKYSKINYIQQVEKYAMPFDLLWTLLVYSQDEDFVYKLAELAIKNDIVVTVHDSVTYTDTVDEKYYTKNVKIHEKSTFSDTTQSPAKVGSTTYEGDRENKYNYKITNKDHHEINTPILAVTYVDSWIAKYENKYKKVHQGPNTSKTEVKEKDDEDYVDDGTENAGDTGDSLVNGWKSDYKSKLTSAYSGTDKEGKEKYSISTVLNYKKKITDRKKQKTTTIEKNTYQSQPAEVQGKYDPKAKEDNFVTLLKKSKKSDNLKSIADWFFESMEEQESICDLVDLMKFLLSKAFNVDYGVNEYDFSIYKPEYFVNVNGGVQGGLVEMLKSFENEALRNYMSGSGDYSSVSGYVTEDKKYYKLYYTSFDGCLNFSYGIMVRDSNGGLNNEGYFAEEGINLSDLINQYNSGQEVLVEVEKIDRIHEKIVSDKRNGIKEEIESHGVQMEGHQYDALTMVAYQYGNCGQYISGSDNIAEKYKTYGNTEQFRDEAICETASRRICTFLCYRNI